MERACDNLGKECVKGAIYTTDAVHRETKRLLNALRERGIIGIDMETSAMYAVGMFRKIKVGNILIVSTNPEARSIGFYSDALRESILEAAKIVKKAVEYLADTP